MTLCTSCGNQPGVAKLGWRCFSCVWEEAIEEIKTESKS